MGHDINEKTVRIRYNRHRDFKQEFELWGYIERWCNIMMPIRKKIGNDGSIVIEEALKIAKIEPGDWVRITPTDNKVIIKLTTKKKQKGVVKAAAGILKDSDLVEKMLRTREVEDDRQGSII
jgi:exosome complex RNA-binding protein Csl4